MQKEGKVLLLDPFYGGSHKQLTDLLYEEIPGCVRVTMTAKKWHWRARTAALYLSRTIPFSTQYRVLFSSSILNLAELVALRPDLSKLQKILYFHENQLVYPKQQQKARDVQYGYNQILSCLVADEVVFNSKYNMESFLNSINTFLNIMPDYKPKGLTDIIRPKCHVLHFPLKLPVKQTPVKLLINVNKVVQDTDKYLNPGLTQNYSYESSMGNLEDISLVKDSSVHTDAENTFSKQKNQNLPRSFIDNVDVALEDTDKQLTVGLTKNCKDIAMGTFKDLSKIKGDFVHTDVETNFSKQKIQNTSESDIGGENLNKSKSLEETKRLNTVENEKINKHLAPGCVDFIEHGDGVLGNKHVETDSKICVNKKGTIMKRQNDKSNINDPLKLVNYLDNSRLIDEDFNTPSEDSATLNENLTKTQVRPLHIVWPHRWEHDKDPETFFETVYKLYDAGLKFKLSVMGEQYTDVPDIFTNARNKLSSVIETWGYQDNKDGYYRVLSEADVVVSTAKHEFFGVAMLEAVYFGCYPVCPNRLVYPEIFPKCYLYNTTNQLYKMLRNFCHRPHLVRNHTTQVTVEKYLWENCHKQFTDLFQSTKDHTSVTDTT